MSAGSTGVLRGVRALLARCPMKPPARDTLLALGAYAVILLAYFHPLLARIDTHIPDGIFYFTHYGNTIFYHFDIPGGFRIPVWTDMVKYPQGGILIFNAWANILFIALLRNVLPLPVVFNLSILLSLLASPVAMYILARELFGNRIAAFAAGLLYGFHPLLQNAVGSGQIEQFHLWAIPLYLYVLVRMLRGAVTWANAAALVVSLLALYMNFPSYAVFALILTVPVVASHAWRRSDGASVSPFVLWFIALVIVATSLGPFLYYRTLCAVPPDDLVLCPADIVYHPPLLERTQRVDIASLVTPRATLPFQFDPFLGFGTVTLLMLSLLPLSSGRGGLWLSIAALFLALAAGPVLSCNDGILTIGGAPAPTPYLLLGKICPFLTLGTPSPRFLYGALFAISLAVAALLAFAAKTFPRRAALLFAAMVLLLILGDIAWPDARHSPLPLQSLEVPEFYRIMARDGRDYAVLEFPDISCSLPLTAQALCKRCALYQTVHLKKLGNNFSAGRNRQLSENRFVRDCIEIVATGRSRGSTTGSGVPWLRERNFRYFILHGELVPKSSYPTLLRFVKRQLGTPVYARRDGLIVFSFDASVSPPLPPRQAAGRTPLKKIHAPAGSPPRRGGER